MINYGNLGGVFVNSKGELIGINVVIVSLGSFEDFGLIGIGFVILLNIVKCVFDEIIVDGVVMYGLFGVFV